MLLWGKNYVYSQVSFHFLKCSVINFPVSSQCRQCLCSFYYLSCSGRGSCVPWVSRSSLRNVSSGRTVSPSILIPPVPSSCCRKGGRLLLQTTGRCFPPPPHQSSRGWHHHRACQAKAFVQHAGVDAVCRLPVSALQDGWGQGWGDADTCLSFHACLPQPQHLFAAGSLLCPLLLCCALRGADWKG